MSDSDDASKIKGMAWVAGACILAVFLALGITPFVRAVPWSWEEKISRSPVFESEMPECRASPQANALLHRLVGRLYPADPDDMKFSISVHVVKDPAVNAFAGLGGKIMVNSGLLAQADSPEEVAGVLAHEIEHVHHRDILKGVVIRLLTTEGLKTIFASDEPSSNTEWTNYFLSMNFTRAQEAAADEGGLQRLQKAHIDNQGFRHFFERMEKSDSVPVFISDHPSNESRSALVEKFGNQNVRPIMSRDEWMIFKHYCR